jgi:3-deoxy-D-manno-octulosonic-acid transferase
VDLVEYLPFDTGGDAAATLDALRPTALVFSKLDVWPVLVEHARATKVRLGLVSATLAPGSGRRGGWAGLALRDAYRRLDLVGAISEDDAGRSSSSACAPTACASPATRATTRCGAARAPST